MKLNRISQAVIFAAMLAFVGCDDNVDPLIEDLELARVLTPIDLDAKIVNRTTIELNWALQNKADHYVVEFSEDSLEFTTIIHSEEVKGNQLQHTFAGETRYSARVKSVGTAGIADSKWATVTIATAAENIFLPIKEDDIKAKEATLRWPANSEVTRIVYTPGNIVHVVTAEEKTAGIATVTGLVGETNYTAKLFNNTKSRGTTTFTTLIDLGGAIAINPGDDLKAILDAAPEGAAYVIFPGTYTIGAYALTKSVKLTGYKSTNKPVILGQFTCAVAVTSIELKSLIFKGNADPAAVFSQFFNTIAGCNLSSLTITDCEISNYQNALISSNSVGVYGAIKISNSYVHDILPAGGGDGIDFRAGSTIASLSVESTTFANGFRAFLRMQVSCVTSFKNCTFYKISALDNSNNTGIFRTGVGGTLEVRNCLLVQTGVAAPTNVQSGNWTRNAGNMVATPTYANNNIFGCLNLLVGLYTTPGAVSATELDPGFVNAAGNNFKITNQTLINNNIGDLHW